MFSVLKDLKKCFCICLCAMVLTAGLPATEAKAATKALDRIEVFYPCAEQLTGSSIDTSLLEVTIYYTDGTSTTDTYKNLNPTASLKTVASGSNLYTIGYTYDSVRKTASFAVKGVSSLSEKTLTRIKASYVHDELTIGAVIATTDVSIVLYFSDGTTETKTYAELAPSATLPAVKAGSNIYTVSYTYKNGTPCTDTFVVEGIEEVEKTLVSIHASYPYAEAVTGTVPDPSKVTVVLTFSKGEPETYTYAQLAPGGTFTALKAGDNTYTVRYTYNGVTRSDVFTIKGVSEEDTVKVLDRITVSYPITTAAVGTTVKASDVSITIYYTDGTSVVKTYAEVTPSAQLHDVRLGVNTYTIHYTYGDVTRSASFTITGTEAKTLSSISVSCNIKNAKIGTAISAKDITVTKNYTDGTHESISYDTIEPDATFQIKGSGNTFTVSIDGHTATFTVTGTSSSSSGSTTGNGGSANTPAGMKDGYTQIDTAVHYYYSNGMTYQIFEDKTASVASGVTSLKGTVKIPKTFKDSTGVTYTVTAIADNAFKSCKRIKAVVIPKTVTTIGAKAFYGCKKLSQVTIKATKLTSVGKSAFKKTASSLKIKVPAKNKKAYTALFKKAGVKSKGIK